MRSRAELARSAMLLISAAGFAVAAPFGAAAQPNAPAHRLAPASLRPVAKVDERFQSYNIEMAEVIGGRFWAPYPKPGEKTADRAGPSGGVDLAATMFRKREPLDLAHNRRLINLTRALGPAYVRVSGAWANTVFFQDEDAPAPATPPPGYQGVLTRAQWAGVVSFAKAVDAKIVTSFPVNQAARDADGVWDPDQARRLVNYTRSIGGSIYAAELINEPNVGPMVGLPKGYSAADFARDEAVFLKFLRTDAPVIKSVGPGSTGEAGFRMFPRTPGEISTEAMLSAEPQPKFDIYSYHFYGAVSERCAQLGKNVGISPQDALSESWLARTDQGFAYYKALHDKFEPGTPIWITETAEASCGGDRWAASFLDTFRYVDQMGRLAKQNVAAIFHNTLAASDYALIDDTTWEPRPSYWAAVLWRRLMGTTVLDAGPIRPGLHVYAQCLRDRPGGVAYVAINLDRTKPAALELPSAAQRYTLTSDDLVGQTVKLNGRVLKLAADDQLPPLAGIKAPKGKLMLAPASITFLAFPDAGAAACRAG
jgi:hypothetical protein